MDLAEKLKQQLNDSCEEEVTVVADDSNDATDGCDEKKSCKMQWGTIL